MKMLIAKKGALHMAWVIVAIIAAFMYSGSSFIDSIIRIFRPAPTIPMWVYVVGFFILFIWMTRR